MHEDGGGARGPGGLPFVSVLVPTHDRPDQLRACLAALAALDYPGDLLEAIVVDDGSASSPAGVVERFGDRLEVTLLRQRRAGPAIARNRGARRARGDLLAFTDDDCHPDPGWVRVLAAAHREDPVAALGGRTVNELTENP